MNRVNTKQEEVKLGSVRFGYDSLNGILTEWVYSVLHGAFIKTNNKSAQMSGAKHFTSTACGYSSKSCHIFKSR